MAFSQGGNQPVAPFLPGSLIGTRLGFSGQRRASDPFSPASVSRSSSSTPTTHNRSPESQQWQGASGVAAAKANMVGFNSAPGSPQGIASNQALGYLRTASLPHVPTQLAAGMLPLLETPATSNHRKLWPVMTCYPCLSVHMMLCSAFTPVSIRTLTHSLTRLLINLCPFHPVTQLLYTQQ